MRSRGRVLRRALGDKDGSGNRGDCSGDDA